MTFVYLFLATLAGLGFLASVVCHVMGWLNIEPSMGQGVFVLHVGIFIVWIPLVISANWTMPKPGRGNFEHLLAELPKWVNHAFKGLFGYVAFNFIYFIYSTYQYPKHRVPFPVELRGFSGHWMFFYGAATAGFWGLARLSRAAPPKLKKDAPATNSNEKPET